MGIFVRVKRLRVGVDGDKINTVEVLRDHAVERRTTTTANAKYLNLGACFNNGFYLCHTALNTNRIQSDANRTRDVLTVKYTVRWVNAIGG